MFLQLHCRIDVVSDTGFRADEPELCTQPKEKLTQKTSAIEQYQIFIAVEKVELQILCMCELSFSVFLCIPQCVK